MALLVDKRQWCNIIIHNSLPRLNFIFTSFQKFLFFWLQIVLLIYRFVSKNRLAKSHLMILWNILENSYFNMTNMIKWTQKSLLRSKNLYRITLRSEKWYFLISLSIYLLLFAFFVFKIHPSSNTHFHSRSKNSR